MSIFTKIWGKKASTKRKSHSSVVTLEVKFIGLKKQSLYLFYLKKII